MNGNYNKRLQEDVVDIEKMSSGISIMDLGLNGFRLDLLDYMKIHHDVENAPYGMNAVVKGNDELPPGVIYVLRNVKNQAAIAQMYNTTPQNITMHIKNIYADGELEEDSTCKEFLQVQTEGSRQIKRNKKHYNFRMILAIGYRVRSNVGVHFRNWASGILEEYTRKGFAINCSLKQYRIRFIMVFMDIRPQS